MTTIKNYVVIGGSTGIGRALALQLSENHNVLATYNSTPTPDNANLSYVPFDVTDESASLDWLPEQIDGLAYCVGAIQLKPFHRVNLDDFLNDYKKQTGGAIRVLQAALPALKTSGNSSVVLFSTVAVQTGFPFHSIVASSKGAIEGLTKALAAEWSPKIRVNAIAPSITQTPMANALLNTPEKIEANAQRHPLKKVGSADELAKFASFLLSEDASWITGQIHHVDGGISSLKV